jgi:hypothetical protein
MTENINTEGAGLDALELVLERFGSDRTRWPAPVRRNFAGLLSSNPEAQKRLREAEALDRLLDLAPMPQIDTRALTDRILGAAAAEAPRIKPDVAARPQGVAPFRRRPPMGAVEAQWPAAALLAASLVLGVFSGFWGTFDTAVAPLMTASAAVETEIDPGQLALDSDGISMFEEDLL